MKRNIQGNGDTNMLFLSRLGKSSIKPMFRCRWKYSETGKFPSTVSNLIDIHSDVLEALAVKKPVVALESTIITHGMPYPFNLDTAVQVEDIVRKEGSTPATIAIINGRIKIGLTNDELEQLASVGSNSVTKCSRRDLAYVLSKQGCGGTTVAATLIVANMVGIKLFATGGIGGVHRDGHISMDISADLIELGRTSVCVVSSGVKSILDIPRTLEYLETQGVAVASYQNARNFPAFYTRLSGVQAPYTLNTPQEAALMIKSSLDLQLESGILIGVPIPEQYALDETLIEAAIDRAIITAKEKGIFGKEITPFLLDALSTITAGKSLNSNMALIKNNARVASQIAVELSYVLKNSENRIEKYIFMCGEKSELRKNNVPVVVGASILDICMTSLEENLNLDGATYKGKVNLSGGGVGRNIAEGLFKLHGDVHLISAVGDDDSGDSLNTMFPASKSPGVIRDPQNATSICTVICDKLGDCKLILGDMKIHDCITPELVMRNEQFMADAPIIIVDGNLNVNTLEAVLHIAKKYNKPVFFEPTDMRIADKPFALSKLLTNQIKFISPNIFELNKIAQALNKSADESFHPIDITNADTTLEIAKRLATSVSEYFDCIILTLGPLGVLIASKRTNDSLFNDKYEYVIDRGLTRYRYYPALKLKRIVNASGAGDSFTSGFISAMLSGASEETCTAIGFKAAQCALLAEGAVPRNYFQDINEKRKWYEDKATPQEY